MEGRKRHLYRPSLCGMLESRLLLSQAPVHALIANSSHPEVNRATLAKVENEVDTAFRVFQGNQTAGDLVRSTGSTIWSSIVAKLSSNPDVPTEKPSQGGDFNLLYQRVNDAVAKLPFGNGSLFPTIAKKFDPVVLTRDNAPQLRDWVKAQVRHYLIEKVREHRFTFVNH